jgi:hypothetical protein
MTIAQRIAQLRGKLRAYLALGQQRLVEVVFNLLWRFAEMLGLCPIKLCSVRGIA